MVNFSKYHKASSRQEKQQTADEIVSAFKEVGFVYLSGHGIPDSTVKNVFAKVGFRRLLFVTVCLDVSTECRLLQHAFRYQGKCWISSPQIEFICSLFLQSKLAWDDPRSNRGFVQKGRERVTQSKDATEIAKLREKAPDFKETMEIGRDWDTVWKNKWPQEPDCPGFKNSMLSFFQVCQIPCNNSRVCIDEPHRRHAMNSMSL